MKVIEDAFLSESAHDLSVDWLIRSDESFGYFRAPVEDSLDELDQILKETRSHFQKGKGKGSEFIVKRQPVECNDVPFSALVDIFLLYESFRYVEVAAIPVPFEVLVHSRKGKHKKLRIFLGKNLYPIFAVAWLINFKYLSVDHSMVLLEVVSESVYTFVYFSESTEHIIEMAVIDVVFFLD